MKECKQPGKHRPQLKCVKLNLNQCPPLFILLFHVNMAAVENKCVLFSVSGA